MPTALIIISDEDRATIERNIERDI